jgi:hypothetical protein
MRIIVWHSSTPCRGRLHSYPPVITSDVYIDVFLCIREHKSIQVLHVLNKTPQGYPEEIRETTRRGEQGHKDRMTMRRVWHTPRRSIHRPGPQLRGYTKYVVHSNIYICTYVCAYQYWKTEISLKRTQERS